MAKKTQRGLPASFALDIDTNSLKGAPVELGDYLDEDEVKPKTPPAEASRPPAQSKVVPIPIPAKSGATSEAPAAPRPPVPKKPAKTRALPAPKLPTRKQLNMTKKTLEMLDDVLDHVQHYTVQKDAKASELIEGLVMALHDAKQHLDLGAIPPRGRWGSPTAHAFPVHLKKAFQQGITDYVRSQEEAETD